MTNQSVACVQFEISPRFRRALEERVARLERDAEFDEAQVAHLADPEHIKRHLRLVGTERAEALRIRLFLDRSGNRTKRN